jgi:hypothetical protein
VHKWIGLQIPRLGVSRHVFHLSSKILSIADAMLIESGLPNLSSKLLSYGRRKASLDALHTAL